MPAVAPPNPPAEAAAAAAAASTDAPQPLAEATALADAGDAVSAQPAPAKKRRGRGPDKKPRKKRKTKATLGVFNVETGEEQVEFAPGQVKPKEARGRLWKFFEPGFEKEVSGCEEKGVRRWACEEEDMLMLRMLRLPTCLLCGSARCLPTAAERCKASCNWQR